MKKQLLLIVCFFVAFAGFANSKYTINDAEVEQVMTESVQVDFSLTSAQVEGIFNTASVKADPNPWVAVVLAIPGLIGWTGVHRLYLGGKGSLILIYVITCGGIFGIVPLVDTIVLLLGAIENDISQFVGNDKFIMW